MVLQSLTDTAPDAALGVADVRLPTALTDHAGGLAILFLPATTIGGTLDALVHGYPALRRHLYADSGALRGYVNIFLNEDEVRTLSGGLATRVFDGDVVMIVPSIAGG